ncbi:hypothetical protein ABFS82_04G024000 [Erythranthe guttata]|uniref:BSD domain-containing protein n=1 Tax=Erythranthe guttata TaxID=4155 RepID=A0A022S2P9_ERYGU|nr:PREDICTED: BSD domain-containing protein 1 [Erythranthe guttata]EYU46629.1 hypothetical protein MIMGU_mgv1a005790mg [Erythranthe guttata]|eukprot:XP_012832701.1 PREDICTED: BSD domain-containing protein 1 [Erythranthe guttata]
MNFFKSILSDDPDPPKPGDLNESDPNSLLKQQPRDDDDSDSSDASDSDPANGWSFGGLIKTFAVRSESMIETYRRDLTEFGSGLKKETEIFRETASRAVKDLPASIEAGASAAHGALDGVLKSTAHIISKESLGFASDGEPETPDTNRSMNSGRYSWFESQLSAIQSDVNTFCEELEDVEDYMKWKKGFELEENRDEIDGVIEKNGTLEGIYRRVVPSAVDHETFWCRYFYRVDKLKLQESVRAKLVKRAISIDDEEELSWDFDDDEGDSSEGDRAGVPKVKGDNVASDQDLNPVLKQEGLKSGSPHEKDNVDANDGDKSVVDVSLGEKEVKSEDSMENNVEKVEYEVSVEGKNDEKVKSEESGEEKNDVTVKSGGIDTEGKNEEKVSMEEKGESGKQADASKVDQLKAAEEELGWDEIEDTGSGDEKKISATSNGNSPNRAELRKRMSAAEDDDDLNWDIEEDDEPVKA